jgi:hypothetical protein
MDERQCQVCKKEHPIAALWVIRGLIICEGCIVYLASGVIDDLKRKVVSNMQERGDAGVPFITSPQANA